MNELGKGPGLGWKKNTFITTGYNRCVHLKNSLQSSRIRFHISHQISEDSLKQNWHTTRLLKHLEYWKIALQLIKNWFSNLSRNLLKDIYDMVLKSKEIEDIQNFELVSHNFGVRNILNHLSLVDLYFGELGSELESKI